MLNSRKLCAFHGWKLNLCSLLLFMSLSMVIHCKCCCPVALPSAGTQANFERQNGNVQCFNKKLFGVVSWYLIKKAQKKELCPLQCLRYYPPTKETINHHSLSHTSESHRFQVSSKPNFQYSVFQLLVQKIWFLYSGPMTVQLHIT